MSGLGHTGHLRWALPCRSQELHATEVFGHYADFFALFVDFGGYVDFWLLHDLVDAGGFVRLFLPSEDFTLPPVPCTLADYLTFCERTLAFVTARNERIAQLGL